MARRLVAGQQVFVEHFRKSSQSIPIVRQSGAGSVGLCPDVQSVFSSNQHQHRNILSCGGRPIPIPICRAAGIVGLLVMTYAYSYSYKTRLPPI